MKLIIDRQNWIRGGRDSLLRRGSDNKMCCLGFLAKACGFSDNDITGVPTPSHLFKNLGLDKKDNRTLKEFNNFGRLMEPYESNKFGEKLYSSIEDIKLSELPIIDETVITGSLMTTNDRGTDYSEEDREGDIIKLMKELDIEIEFIN